MRVAIEGCSHGCLDQIYASVLELDRRDGKRTDLLLLCGDVQTLRNPGDLHCLAVPDKYKQMGDFYRYYSGERVAPILTIMIGGNHEASNYLWELFYGGWMAPNIYYLGAAGCVDVAGLTICGISGIYKSHDYRLGHHERIPYTGSTVRSVYHTRSFDVDRLALLASLLRTKEMADGIKPDIVMSHDWPNTIEQHGDVSWLSWKKPFFKQEIASQTLGSPPLMTLLHALRPKYWFSAHLHVRFAALMRHNDSSQRPEPHKGGSKSDRVAEENNAEVMDVQIDSDEENVADTAVLDIQSPGQERVTRFLALSKCLVGQDFLQMLEIPNDNHQIQPGSSDDQPSISFTITWLAVLKVTERYLSLERHQPSIPKSEDASFQIELSSALEWVTKHIAEINKLDVRTTQTFVQTAPPMSSGQMHQHPFPPPWYTNPQTVALCSLLEIPNRINAPPLAAPLQNPGHPGEEAEEIRRIELAAMKAMQRKDEVPLQAFESEEINVTLSSDEEDESIARWKEGTG